MMWCSISTTAYIHDSRNCTQALHLMCVRFPMKLLYEMECDKSMYAGMQHIRLRKPEVEGSILNLDVHAD